MNLPYHTPLSAEEQKTYGLEVPQPMAIADKVRFAELDHNNHVNNKAYVAWFETLRVGYFDHFFPDAYGDQPRPRTVVHSLNVRFLREMLRDQSYVATVRVAAFRNSSFTMEQQLWSEGYQCATASVIMVMLEREGTRRATLPAVLKQAFIARDGAEDHAAA